MGEVVDFKSRKIKNEEEVKEEASVVKQEEERYEALQEGLQDLNLEKALKIEGKNLQDYSLENNKSISEGTFRKIIFDSIAGQSPDDFSSPDKKIALNNLLNNWDADEIMYGKGISGLSLDRPSATDSVRVRNIEYEIREKKSSLLKEFLGDKVVGQFNSITDYLTEKWSSEEIQEELRKELEGIKSNPEKDPYEFLLKAEHIASLNMGPEETIDFSSAQMLKKIEEARRALKEGAIFSTHPDDPFLDMLVEKQRATLDDLASRRTAATIQFIKDKVALRAIQYKIENS